MLAILFCDRVSGAPALIDDKSMDQVSRRQGFGEAWHGSGNAVVPEIAMWPERHGAHRSHAEPVGH